MSTPSEKSPELIELSDYLTRQMRDPVSSEPENPVEAESDLPRSPYAPKSAPERAAARLRVLANNDGDPAASAYAPKRARLPEEESSISPDAKPAASARETRYAAATPLAHSEDVASVNAPSLSLGRASAESSQPGRRPPDKDGPANQSRISARAHSDKHPADPGAISAFAPARSHDDETAKPAPSEIWRRIMADQELARIETSLRLLQRRQVAGMRLPRGPNLALSGHLALPAEDTMGGTTATARR
jgi:hypothetical protein